MIAFLFNISPRWENEFPKIKKLIEKFALRDKEFFVVDRSDSYSIENHLQRIVSGTFDAIVILGGDGTIHRIINFLKQNDALERFKLAVIPFGTCNDFSKIAGFKNLRFKKRKIVSLLKSLSGGHTKSFSIAKVNNRCFINNAGFGRRFPHGESKKSSLRDIRGMRPVHLNVKFDGREIEGDYLMMVCANAPYFSGGLHFSKDSNPSDRKLEFFFVKNVSKLRIVGKLFLGKQGIPLRRKNDKIVERIETSKLALKSDSPIWMMADGESVPELSEIREAHFEIDGRAHFVVPPE